MFLFAITVSSGLLCAGLIVLLRPLLVRYALARPNARASHVTPTPQGGGIAVLLATLMIAAGAIASANLVHKCGCGDEPSLWSLYSHPILIGISAISLALVGLIDDIRPLPPAPRLVLQACAVGVVIFVVDARLVPQLPLWIERGLQVLAGLWFVNLVNFMDGLDWITVAEMIPLTGFIAILYGRYVLNYWYDDWLSWTAAALCGALLGFAPFNKPVARLFLGDVGSLSIGLLVGWMLLDVARRGMLAAAILLPLYYLMDATITLLRRLARGEKVWQAHRSHFYQQATDNGFSALSVSAHVFALNIALIALAAVTLVWNAVAVQVVCLVAGVLLVSLLLKRFATHRPEVL